NSYSLLGLYAIASCVIGGVSFSGGVGKIRGVVFGVILFQLIRNSTGYIGLTTSVGNVFIGIVVAFAVVFDMLKYRQRS
ncbi:MAG: beta-methylgalactoside transporter permease, partial [Firmicutes bacterium]|nr:beta-methylgalactoside transporter permease [Bacillota bacterium]